MAFFEARLAVVVKALRFYTRRVSKVVWGLRDRLCAAYLLQHLAAGVGLLRRGQAYSW